MTLAAYSKPFVMTTWRAHHCERLVNIVEEEKEDYPLENILNFFACSSVIAPGAHPYITLPLVFGHIPFLPIDLFSLLSLPQSEVLTCKYASKKTSVPTDISLLFIYLCFCVDLEKNCLCRQKKRRKEKKETKKENRKKLLHSIMLSF